METIIITDAQHAKRIRAAQVEFHAAIDAAYEAGLGVRFGLFSWCGQPEKCHTSNLKIARRFPWDDDRKDIEL